jgi:hypothetical protein
VCVGLELCVTFCVVLYGFLFYFYLFNIMMCNSPVFSRKKRSTIIDKNMKRHLHQVNSNAMQTQDSRRACLVVYIMLC